MKLSSEQNPLQTLRLRLIELLAADQAVLARAWIDAMADNRGLPAEALTRQAERFLTFLAEGLATTADAVSRMEPGHDALLQQEFPAVSRISALLALAGILAERIAEPGDASLPAFIDLLQAAITAHPPAKQPRSLFTERLARLSQLSIELSHEQAQGDIMRLALDEAPRLVGARSSAFWLWDADQGVPMILETAEGYDPAPTLPPYLLQLFRQASECAFNIDAGESDEHWPPLLADRSIAFIPLPDEHGCRGILTVHAEPNRGFTTDDVLLLSSLGNLVSMALQNAQWHEKEHQLINLLQSSIGRLVKATSGSTGHLDEFITPLVQFAEGLTRADAVGAYLVLDNAQGMPMPAIATSMHLPLKPTADLTEALHHLSAERTLPPAGAVSELSGQLAIDRSLAKHYYAIVPIQLGNRSVGILVTLSAVPLNDEQTTFLHTIAGVVGVGLANMQQSRSNEVLVVQLNELIGYITDVITRQLAAHDDAAQQIMKITAEKIAQAAHMPISICGWVEDDGTIRVLPDTTVGIPKALEEKLVRKVTDHAIQLPLTVNNRVIRAALNQQVPQTMGQEPNGVRPTFRWLLDQGVADWIVLPMVIQSQAKGVAILADVEKRTLPNREKALLSTYANQAALALENSLLNEERRRKLAQTEKLYEYASSISANLVINNILKRTMHSACEILHADTALITLSDDKSVQQRSVMRQGFARSLVDDVVFPDDGIIGTAAQRRRTIASVDVQDDGRDHVLRKLAIDGKVASSLTAPIMTHTHGVLIGTLTVFSRAMREFAVEEEQLLQTIASQAAVAIQSAQLLAHEKQRAHDLHALVHDISRSVPIGILEISMDLLEIARGEDDVNIIRTTRERLDCLAAVQQEFCDEAPGMLNVKGAMLKLASRRMLQEENEPRPRLSVLGAAVCLPWRQAMLLGLFVLEWLQAAERAAADVSLLTVDIMFQQAGEDITVQINDNVDWTTAPAISSELLKYIQQALNGAVQESPEGGAHYVRYRFRLAP